MNEYRYSIRNLSPDESMKYLAAALLKLGFKLYWCTAGRCIVARKVEVSS